MNTLIALALVAFTLDGLQLQPLPGTVRVGAAVDMAWQVTDTNGASWQQRIAVTGCAAGAGELSLVEDDGTPSVPGTVAWARGDAVGRIAITICNAAGQS